MRRRGAVWPGGGHAPIDQMIQDLGQSHIVHAAADPLFTATWSDKRGSENPPMRHGAKALNHGGHPAPTRPHQPLHRGPSEPMTCSGKENEAVRATKNEGGGGVRATTCGERAAGCSLSVYGQPLPRVQRATPRRKPVGDFYVSRAANLGDRQWSLLHSQAARSRVDESRNGCPKGR